MGNNVALMIVGLMMVVLATAEWAVAMRRGMRRGIELQQQLSRHLAQLTTIGHFDRLQQAALQLALLDPSADAEQWQAARARVLKAVEDVARDRLGLT